MCYIITAIKLQENEPAKKAILQVLASEQENNDDGTGSVCFDRATGEPKLERKMWKSPSKMLKDLNSFEVINYHFRTSTAGAVDKSNIHFWKKGNWIFCHNGTISGQTDEKASDSNKFFSNIIEKGFLKVYAMRQHHDDFYNYS